jgi:hypothetical protein
MVGGVATITYWADDLAAAAGWSAELVGVGPSFQRPGPRGAWPMSSSASATTRPSWAWSTAASPPRARRPARAGSSPTGTSMMSRRPWRGWCRWGPRCTSRAPPGGTRGSSRPRSSTRSGTCSASCTTPTTWRSSRHPGKHDHAPPLAAPPGCRVQGRRKGPLISVNVSWIRFGGFRAYSDLRLARAARPVLGRGPYIERV